MTLLLALALQTAPSGPSPRFTPEACVDAVAVVAQALPSATAQQIRSLIAAFTLPDCDNAVEFNEWGNEVLFDALERQPGLFFATLFSAGEYPVQRVSAQLASPIHDGINVCRRYRAVKAANMPRAMKARALHLLKPVCAWETKTIRQWERRNHTRWEWSDTR